jgi:hypothetical protein
MNPLSQKPLPLLHLFNLLFLSLILISCNLSGQATVSKHSAGNTNETKGENPENPGPGDDEDNERDKTGGDGNDGGDNNTDPPELSSRFQNVIRILDNNCFSCHISYTVHTSPQDWVVMGLVIPGDPINSKLYRYLKGSDTNGPRSMPIDFAALSPSDLAEIRAWIDELD